MVGEWIEKVDYLQAPPMAGDEFVSLFEEALYARLGTINEDSTIHIAPVYFRYKNGQILMATQDPSRKVRNIKRNNKVSVLIDITDVPYREYALVGPLSGVLR